VEGLSQTAFGAPYLSRFYIYTGLPHISVQVSFFHVNFCHFIAL